MNFNNSSIIIGSNIFNQKKIFKKRNLYLNKMLKPNSTFFYLPKELSKKVPNNKTKLKFNNFPKKKLSFIKKDKQNFFHNTLNEFKKQNRKSFSSNGKNHSLSSLNSQINKKLDNNLKYNNKIICSHKVYSIKRSYSNDTSLNNENKIFDFNNIKNYFKNKFEKSKKKIEGLYHKNNKDINNVFYLNEEFPNFITNIFLNEIQLFNSQNKNLQIFYGKIENILNISEIKDLFFEEIIHKILQRNLYINFQNVEIIKKDIVNIIKKEFSYFINVGKNLKNEENKINYIFPIKEFINIYRKKLKKKRQFDQKLLKTYSNLTINKNINKSSSSIDINKENDIERKITIERDLIENDEKIKIKELKRRNKENELMKIFIESEKKNETKNLSEDEIKIKKKKYFDSNNIISKEHNLFFYKFHCFKNKQKKLKDILNIQSLSQTLKNKFNKIFFEYDEQKSKFEKEKKYILNKIFEYIKNLKKMSTNNQNEIDFCEKFQNKIILFNHKKNNDYILLKDEFKNFRKKIEKIKNDNFIRSRNFHLIKKRNNFYDYHYIFPKMSNLKFQNINKTQFMIINSNKNKTFMLNS